MNKYALIAVIGFTQTFVTVPFMLLVWSIVSLIGAWWSIVVAIVAGALMSYLEGLLWSAGLDKRLRRKPRELERKP